MNRNMRIFILEDEVPAKKKLVSYLMDFFGEATRFDCARSVKEGIEFLQANQDYHLILSDIKLLDGTAFDVFGKVTIKAPIIFCTAYDEHLLEAFQSNGIAYILKPYQKRDLESALEKFEVLFEPKVFKKDMFYQLKEALESNLENYKKRFAIKKRDGIQLLETSQIVLIQAHGDFCQIVDSNGLRHSISKNMGTLTKELDPKQFFRINRSQIVGIGYIEKITPYAKNRLALKITGVKENAITSTATTRSFRLWIES